MFDLNRAHTLTDDGLVIEDGYHFVSGALDPAIAIPTVTVPTLYFKTTGEIWKNDTSGWSQFSGSSFDEDIILTDNFFDVLVDNEGNVLRGLT